MTSFADLVDEYLAVRRAVGFTLDQPARDLARFAAFLDARRAEVITTDLVLSWASEKGAAARRLANARIFARYVAALDPATEVPPPGLLPVRSRRLVPYLYSEDEIKALMEGAEEIEPELWGATCRTVLGLLWATGMRVGEALRLEYADVSFHAGRLTVWRSKSKSRHVPLSPSTLEALAAYDRLRRRCAPEPATTHFFRGRRGGAVPYMALRDEFVRLLERTGVPHRPAPQRPRIHDLRHSFAVRTVLGWYRSGEDVGALLPRLSTYLGHSEPASTYWYLSAAPELMALAAERLEVNQP
jgi:integrase/recombinase XerD